MLIHSYVVARDLGFAPNPFHNICTLATCMPIIRKAAKIGDLIVGTRVGIDKKNYLVYAMKVTSKISFEEYWHNAEYNAKRPNMYGTRIQAYGDNIYNKNSDNAWHQEFSHHSYPDGKIHGENLAHDTQSNFVLISKNFVYWGSEGLLLEHRFLEIVKKGRGHKSKIISKKTKEDFLKWFDSLEEYGLFDFPKDFHKKRKL